MITIFPVRKGQSLIEAIAAVAMLALVVTALVGLSVGALKTAGVSRNRSRAVSYAQEGMEAIRSIRDRSFSDLYACSDGGTERKLVWSGSQWSCQGGTETIGIFSRSFTATRQDGGRKLLVSLSVRWRDSLGDQSVILDSYLTDWR